MSNAILEIRFLIDFYRDMGNKRGRSIAFKIEAIDMVELENYLNSYLDLKQFEYKVVSVSFTIQQA